MSTANWYVEIVEIATDRIEKRMGPMSEGKADRVMMGVDINLDHSRFFSRVVAKYAAGKP